MMKKVANYSPEIRVKDVSNYSCEGDNRATRAGNVVEQVPK